MKKKYTVLFAAILLSVSGFCQYYNVSNAYNANNGVLFDHSAKTQMNVIGNPSRDVVTLQINNPAQTKYELSLYSSEGKKVATVMYDAPAGVSTKQIYVSQLQRGMYFLVAVSADDKRSINVLLQ